LDIIVELMAFISMAIVLGVPLIAILSIPFFIIYLRSVTK
jgi:hypothetical protein